MPRGIQMHVCAHRALTCAYSGIRKIYFPTLCVAGMRTGCQMQNFVCRRTHRAGASRTAESAQREALAPDAAYWLLIREALPQSLLGRAMRTSLSVARRARRRSTAPLTVHVEALPLLPERRVDGMTAQRVEVSLIFQLMLGTSAGAEYLLASGVAASVALRVLGSQDRRPSLPLVAD